MNILNKLTIKNLKLNKKKNNSNNNRNNSFSSTYMCSGKYGI